MSSSGGSQEFTQPVPPVGDRQIEGDDLLQAAFQEMRRAVGFDNDAELRDSRERALNYIKGDMVKDVPSLPNRSKAVSSDINDAVETLLPDLMEIFTGGDDVVAFIPIKAEDEEAAQQETAYLNHVVFQDNTGFLNFYTAIKDALILKTGIFMFDWEHDVNEEEEEFEGKSAIELQMAAQDGEVCDLEQDQPGPLGPETTFSFTVKKTKDNSQARYWAIAPDDFAVAPDTINIQESTYCVCRFRPRVQDLIAAEYDPEKVRSLPNYIEDNTVLQIARDTAGEHTVNGSGGDQTPIGDLRQVEIRKHYIRILNVEKGELELWRVVTDAHATIELDREKIHRIPFSAGSPYLTAHRFYGCSLADILFEIQKIKTALMRAVLDSTYFSLNQRMEVAQNDSNDYTISDLLRNEPGAPVRSKTGQAVRPISAGGLGFDPYQALEYFSTVSEGRTGVVRNAQGLNPDTLHDTASGAMMLLSAAQKRTKMIARILAETLIKPLYLGMHALIRENASGPRIAQLLGKWVPVDPTQWHERTAMTVEVGLGASGKDMEIAAMDKIIGSMAAIVQEQGGAQGPIVTMRNVYKAATDQAKKLGVKAPEEYYSDPSQAPPQQPKPDPEMIKVQGQQQLAQQKQQGDMQATQAKQQADMAMESAKLQSEEKMAQFKATLQAQVTQQQNQLEHERAQADQANQLALEQLKIASAEHIAIEVARINAEAKIEAARISAKNQTDDGAKELARQESLENT